MRELPQQSVEVTSPAPGRIAVRGSLTFATASHAREAGVKQLATAAANPVEVDLSAVTLADSAGLAVLLDWLAVAAKRRQRLHFNGIPAAIQAVAHISEVQSLLDEGLAAPPTR